MNIFKTFFLICFFYYDISNAKDIDKISYELVKPLMKSAFLYSSYIKDFTNQDQLIGLVANVTFYFANAGIHYDQAMLKKSQYKTSLRSYLGIGFGIPIQLQYGFSMSSSGPSVRICSQIPLGINFKNPSDIQFNFLAEQTIKDKEFHMGFGLGYQFL